MGDLVTDSFTGALYSQKNNVAQGFYSRDNDINIVLTEKIDR